MKFKFIFRRYRCLWCSRRFFTEWGLLHHREKKPIFEGLGAIVDDTTDVGTYGSLKSSPYADPIEAKKAMNLQDEVNKRARRLQKK